MIILYIIFVGTLAYDFIKTLPKGYKPLTWGDVFKLVYRGSMLIIFGFLVEWIQKW